MAVKCIRLEGLSETEIARLMHEVESVKRLSHPSIVKYEGMARDSDTLSIVLEYVEPSRRDWTVMLNLALTLTGTLRTGRWRRH